MKAARKNFRGSSLHGVDDFFRFVEENVVDLGKHHRQYTRGHTWATWEFFDGLSMGYVIRVWVQLEQVSCREAENPMTMPTDGRKTNYRAWPILVSLDPASRNGDLFPAFCPAQVEMKARAWWVHRTRLTLSYDPRLQHLRGVENYPQQLPPLGTPPAAPAQSTSPPQTPPPPPPPPPVSPSGTFQYIEPPPAPPEHPPPPAEATMPVPFQWLTAPTSHAVPMPPPPPPAMSPPLPRRWTRTPVAEQPEPKPTVDFQKLD